MKPEEIVLSVRDNILSCDRSQINRWNIGYYIFKVEGYDKEGKTILVIESLTKKEYMPLFNGRCIVPYGFQNADYIEIRLQQYVDDMVKSTNSVRVKVV